MSKQDQIENTKRQIEIAKNNLAVAEANLKKLESVRELKVDKLWIKEHGVYFVIGLRSPYAGTNLIPDEAYKIRDCFTVDDLRELANGILKMIGDK